MKKLHCLFKCMAYISMFILIFSASSAFGANSLIPDDLEIRDQFRNGVGPSVGRVVIVQGKTVVMHKGEEHGYLLERNAPVFNGDYIVTGSAGRVKLSMQDDSEITMIPNSKFTISRSSYDNVKKSFASYFKVTYGKLRFRVMKLIGRKHAHYRVKTPTMTCGVRGSDFMVEVDESGNTVVTTFGDTELEVWNNEYPENKVILGSWQQTEVNMGEFPTPPVDIPFEDREPMMRAFDMAGEGDQGGSGSQPDAAPGPGKRAAGETGVLVPEERLLEPDALIPSAFQTPETPDVLNIIDFTGEEADAFDQQIEIQETIKEQEEIIELPLFPTVPE